jgi:hypothetical protein
MDKFYITENDELININKINAIRRIYDKETGELSSYEVSLDSRVFIFVSNDDYKGLLRMIVDQSLVYNIDGEMSYKHNLEYFT